MTSRARARPGCTRSRGDAALSRQRRYPIRQCTGCRQVRPKREMIRVVRTPDGQVVLDATGKRSGRGAYVCPNPDCLTKALNSNRLARSLEVQILPETVSELERECQRAAERLKR